MGCCPDATTTQCDDAKDETDAGSRPPCEGRGDRHIGTEHVLLALAGDTEGLAGQVLTRLEVREAVESETGEVIASLDGPTGDAGHADDAVRVDFRPDTLSNHPIRVLNS